MTDTTSPTPDLHTAWTESADALRRYLARRVRNPDDVDDLLQDVFVKLASAPPSDVPPERIGRWLYRVARNALIDARRRGRLRQTEALAPETALPDAERTGRSLAECVGPMILALPPIYAEALRATELDGMTQRDLATSLGLSDSAIKSRVQRGREMLRANIQACCNPTDDLTCGGCEDEAPCH